MTWIKIIPYQEADGKLKRIYERILGPNDYIDNIMKVHSLRPHTLQGHMTLYKNILHHAQNSFPGDFLEAIGIYVSFLNGCSYCVEHHYQGLRKILSNDALAERIQAVLSVGKPENVYDGKQLEAMKYARKLTVEPGQMNEADYRKLVDAGLDDGEILEINQVVSYFAYANRTVLGLGVDTAGDILGLSPSDVDSENWSHK